MKPWLFLIGCLYVAAANANPIWVEVKHEHNRYMLQADVLVAAPVAEVRRILTDYNHLTQLNPAIRQSTTYNAPLPYDVRVATVIEACIAFYCRRLRRVEDVHEEANRLVAIMVPELSDFRTGRAEWRFIAHAKNTMLYYRAEFEPAFSVPPLIGPTLIRQSLASQLKTLLHNVKQSLHNKP